MKVRRKSDKNDANQHVDRERQKIDTLFGLQRKFLLTSATLIAFESTYVFEDSRMRRDDDVWWVSNGCSTSADVSMHDDCHQDGDWIQVQIFAKRDCNWRHQKDGGNVIKQHWYQTCDDAEAVD